MFLFGFVPGIGVWLMMFATTVIMSMMIQPLINKALLGYWLWFSPPEDVNSPLALGSQKKEEVLPEKGKQNGDSTKSTKENKKSKNSEKSDNVDFIG